DVAALVRLIVKCRAEVVFLDSKYLTLGPDEKGRPVDTNNLAIMGRLLKKVEKACAKVGATVVFVDHATKYGVANRAREREPLQLPDLQGSGISQAAAQWMLVSYLVPYDPNTGRCKLWLSIGGRANPGGLHVVSIDEGVRIKGAPLEGRRWQVSVVSG